MALDPAEVQAAVEKIVPGFVQYPYDRSGTRSVGTSFEGFRSASIGCFLARDGAPFYVVALARDRLLVLTDALKTSLRDLIMAAGASARYVQPVTKTNTLTNAKVALEQLSTAMATRTGVYQAIATVPSFRRFEQNVNQFLSDEGKKARYRGDLVDTPQQARATLRPGAVQMRADWQDLLDKTTLWAHAIDNYTALNLPAALSQVILANAATTLRNRIEQLDGLSPENRLSVLRDTVVDLVASKATVRGFGSLTPPTTFLLLSGVGYPFAGVDHPAIPAALSASFFEGYSVYLGQDTMNLLVDGTYSINVQPPGSFVARLDSSARGPFTVDPAATTFTIDTITTGLTGVLQYVTHSVVLPSGTVEPWTVTSCINAQAPHAVGHLNFILQKSAQEVVQQTTGPLTADFTLVAPLTWTALGTVVGDRLLFTLGLTDALWRIDGIVGNVASATSINGVILPDATYTVTLGADANLRFYIQVRDTVAALSRRTSLRIEDLPGNAGTLAQMSLFSGTQSETVRTSAAGFARAVNQSALSASLDGVARVSATTEFVPTFFSGLGRTHPEDPFLLTYYDVRTEATILSTTPTTTILDSLSIAGLGIGATVVVRGTNSIGDTNAFGIVTAVTGSQCTLDVVLVGTGQALVEAALRSFFPHASVRGEYVLTIDENQLFDGSYSTAPKPAPTPLDVYVASALPGNIGFGGQPVFIQSLRIGQQRVVFHSQSTTLTSALSVLGTGNFDVAFTAPPFPRTEAATTTWVKMPSIPQRLELGDLLEIYQTDNVVPSIVRTVKSIDMANRLIQLDSALPANLPPLNFETTSLLPYARIRKTVKQNYDSIASAVRTWLARSTNNMLRSFHELDAVLNPLLANTSPSVPQANAAQQKLTEMLDTVTALETVLMPYNAGVVEDVDALIKGFLQKGLDRAVDVLLMADFTNFFALDADDSSYAGNLQKNLRAVQKMDFPMRKDNRVDALYAASEQTLAQFDDVDFEYTADHLDPNKSIDITEPSSPSFTLPL